MTSSHLAHTYHPLPVTLCRGEGSWLWDTDGVRYFDALAGYSALNFGHRNPQLLAAAHHQLDTLTLTSRAFDHDLLDPFAAELTELTGTEMMVPMNTGAEAVETAIKAARKWAATARGLSDRGTIVVAENNFHGRTSTIVSFSTDPVAHDDFGPYAPGFTIVPYGDEEALRAAIDDETIAVLLEPIQGEAGVIVPPDGYLAAARRLTRDAGALLILDEVQSGLGRTGSTLASQLVDVQADLYTLGKALGGGIVPVSATIGSAEVLGAFTPGSHGSTFGGNPVACAVGRAVVELLATGEPQARARELGEILHAELATLTADGLLHASRGVGLWAGLDIDPALATGRQVCEALLGVGVLAKDTHGSTIRLSPPLTTTEEDLRWMLARLREVLEKLRAA